MDLGVTEVDPDGEIRFKSGGSVRAATGFKALLQEILIELLSDPLPNTARGSGLRRLVLGTAPRSVVYADIAQAVALTAARVKANQSESKKTLPDEQYLENMSLLSANLVDNSWDIRLAITNRANQSAVVVVPS